MARKSKKTVPKVKGSVRFLAYVIAAVFAAVASFAVYLGVVWAIDNKLPAFSNGGIVHISESDNIEDVIGRIDSVLHPLHPKSIRRAIATENAADRLHPGAYTFKPTHSARYVARAITRGWQTPVRLTLSGSIRSKEAIASKISSQMMVDSVTVIRALNDKSLLSRYGTDPVHVFEMIIPDTYELYWDWDMDKILNRLKKECDLFWNKDRVAKAKAQGLTPAQVSVLASIVAEETNKKDEFPKIASVYLTRLHKGMKLQACPTVRYIYDYKINRVLFSHLSNPSPYNTYMHAGLPPSPICVPTKEHIEAVLNPDPHKYMFFCADSSFNGRNVFAETYSEHLENARKYHVALDELQAAKAAAAKQDQE